MFTTTKHFAVGIALAAFLTSAGAFAADTAATANTDASKTPSTGAKAAKKKPAKKKRAKTAEKAAAAKTEAAPSTEAATGTATAPSTETAAAPIPPAEPAASPAAATAAPAAAAPVKTAIKVAATATDDDSPEAIRERSGSGDPIAGKDKSELCQGCHGEEGISAESTAPKLAGQYAGYIIKEIRDFRSGLRVHQIMSDVAKTVNEEDLPDIAAYFASRKKMKGNGSNNKVGEELFLHGDMTPDMSKMVVACVNCHGVNGKGKTPTNPVFPVLGGQHKDYLRVQLINFRSGDRGNSPGGVMNIITQKLTDAEIEALADYISGL